MTVAQISPEQQIANVQECLLDAVKRLHDYWGLTMQDAKRVVRRTRSLGGYVRRTKYPEWSDCWAALAALVHWRALKAAHALGRLQPLPDDGLPF